MNAWKLGSEGANGSIVYQPAMLSRKALYLFPLALLGSLVWIVGSLWWTRRLRR